MKKFGLIVAGLLFISISSVAAEHVDYSKFDTTNEALAYFGCNGLDSYDPGKGSLGESMADAFADAGAFNACE